MFSSFHEGIGADPNKPKAKKAKLIRLERKNAKMSAATRTQSSSDSVICNTLQVLTCNFRVFASVGHSSLFV